MIETLHKCRKCIFPLFKYDKIFVKIYARTLFTKVFRICFSGVKTMNLMKLLKYTLYQGVGE